MASGRTMRGAVAAAVGLLGWAPAADAATIRRESFQAPGGLSEEAAGTISADGRYVAWLGIALDGSASNPKAIYWRDRVTGANGYVTTIDTLTPSAPSISADGRYIVYAKANLVPQGLGQKDVETCSIMRFDRTTGASLWLKSILPSGTPRKFQDCFYEQVRLSANGRYVAFTSGRDDLVPGDANGTSDVFRLEVATGKVDLVSATPAGAAGNGASTEPSISADGRYVAFRSQATDLLGGVRGVPSLGFYRADMGSPRGGPFAEGRGMLLASVDLEGKAFPSGIPYGPYTRARSAAISDDGTRVAFFIAGSHFYDGSTYVRNLAAFPSPRTTRIVPKDVGPVYGVEPGAISGSGRYLACRVLPSSGTFYHFYAVVDLATGQTVWADPKAKTDDYYAEFPEPSASFSADGSVLAFLSFGDLVPPPKPYPGGMDLYSVTLP